mmetsp:Transcript_98934/g.282989  ORF Transcript_98934/g.282989 Transcript_98934/m.282989 type:complete len:113 (+) Transcript_98934:826-1164(+)
MYDLHDDSGNIPFIYASFLYFTVLCLMMEVPWVWDSNGYLPIVLAQAILAIYNYGILEVSRSLLRPYRSRHVFWHTVPRILDMSVILAESHRAVPLWSVEPPPSEPSSALGL